jgi:hypothetical protein
VYCGERDLQKEMDDRYDSVLKKVSREISLGTVKVYRELSVEAAQRMDDGELDLVYIGGDHSYEGVSQDLKSFFPKVKKRTERRLSAEQR